MMCRTTVRMPSLILLTSLWLLSALAPAKAWYLADRILGQAPYPRAFLRTQPHQQRHSSSALPAAEPTSQQQQQQEYFAGEQTFSWVGDTANDLQKDNDDTLELLKTVITSADGRKAENIVALYVAPVTTLTRYLVIVSGNSRPQNQAIANAVRKDVEATFDIRPGTTGVPEGSADSGWMLLDFGSIMVHVMTPKSRLYYNIEGQWLDKGAKAMDVSEYLVPNAPPAAATSQNEGAAAEPAPEQDPFWS
ncbi:hypothetical protein MPSEU_000178400 [Mayamaea pseudoterrestris]|nr:hypothetical protein MPSEU_000178400 [Mayamaea pseudoterrestris]